VVGSKDAKVAISQIGTELLMDSFGAPLNFSIDAKSAMMIEKVKLVDRNLVFIPTLGFSGKHMVSVTVTNGSVQQVIQIPLVVLPEPASKPSFTPSNSRLSTVTWSTSPNATSYSIFINGKKSCTTKLSSCRISRIVGPKTEIVVVANGGDSTVSQKVSAEFKSNTVLEVARIVGVSSIKQSLSSADINLLNRVVTLVKNEGFRTVVISQITRSKMNQALDKARILSIQNYVQEKVGKTKVTFEIVPASTFTTLNIISVKS
jgi:hypothetical protein